jgi:hypothetical protein
MTPPDAAASATGPARRLREEAAQLVLLTRHFFDRLFLNDVVNFEDQMKERLIAVLAILAVVVGWSSQMVLFGYNFTPDVNISWLEKNYVFIVVMIIFGIVALLEWEMLFLDRRDFLALTPLPIRMRTIFAAKLMSFVVFIGLFSAAMNSLSCGWFALYLTQWRSASPLFFVRYILAHLASAFAACFCVFFACVFVHFLIMAALPPAAYRRVSLVVRFLLIALFVFLLLSFLVEPAIVSRSLPSLAKLKDHGAPFFFRLPSLWFVGLYEVLLGTEDPAFRRLAGTAVLALALSLGAFVLACALSYLRHARAALEAAKRRRPLFRLSEMAGGLFQRIVLRGPEERAVAGFFSRTVRTSVRHRTMLTNYAAVAAGFVMLLAVANRQLLRSLTPENAFFLAQPLVLFAILLAALRVVVCVPASLECNWIFRTAESPRRGRYVSGLKKAVFFKWLLPLAVLIFLFHVWLWPGWQAALGHALFGLAAAAVGMEALFFRFDRIPFASAYVPGKFRLQSRGILFVGGLAGLLAALARLEKWLLESPSRLGVFMAVSAAAWALLNAGSALHLRRNPLVYDEQPEPAMISLTGGD